MSERTVHLSSNEQMLLTLVSSIVNELSPVAEATGLEADIDIGRTDGAITRISVTIPDETWALPLLRGCGDAISKQQDLVYVDGWGHVCKMLLRVPWFVPLDQKAAGARRPVWTPPSDDELPEPVSPPGMNEFLCSWIFISNVEDALRTRFVHGDADVADEFVLVHPEVREEIAYRMYARAVRAWCRCFALPDRLIAATERVTRGWQPEMREWLESLRPEIAHEIARDGDVVFCRLTMPRAARRLLSRALMALGNLVVAASREQARAHGSCMSAGVWPATPQPSRSS